MFRLLVTGSRHVRDYAFVAGRLDALLAARPNVTVVHGAARGVDLLAQRYADERGLAAEAYPAEWAAYGRSAGPRRNAAMVAAMPGGPDCGAVAFRANRSPGTTDCVDRCLRAGLVTVVYDVTLGEGGLVVSHRVARYNG